MKRPPRARAGCHARALREQGCAAYQGYLASAPLFPTELSRWLGTA